jgi:glycerol-3-phosphate acyltransferase PlsX
LLGLKGVAIVGHGRSNANAIKNAIRVAKQFYESGVNGRIEEELANGRRERGESREQFV